MEIIFNQSIDHTIWSMFKPAFSKTTLDAGIGAANISTGSEPAKAIATTRARGFKPYF